MRLLFLLLLVFPFCGRVAAGCGGMALIPGGEFLMGSLKGNGGSDERPRHTVRLESYSIDKCEVTAAQYEVYAKASGRAMPGQPAWSSGSSPVVGVDWFEAEAYCERSGKRLPTEAEWERAARGGTDSEYAFGDDAGKLWEYAWYNVNSEDKARPVGEKKPNRYGLFDMHGNAAEWVADWYDPGYYAKSPVADPKGPGSGTFRVIRGGAWDYYAFYFSRNLRAADRYWNYPARRSPDVGFRCAR